MMSSTSAVLRLLRLAMAPRTVAARCCGMVVGQGALADLADAARRAAGVDDEGFGHGGVLPERLFEPRRTPAQPLGQF